ncbi:hypothetical protein B0T13DRAFT_400618, partial [Neurospora crassa]
EVDKVNLYYSSINYKIEVKKDKYNKEILLPYRLFYSILRDEFLILRKIFRDFLNKGFIYTSKSLVIVLSLFIQKSSGGL